jgi:two-component system sensor histidine kinase BaeS
MRLPLIPRWVVGLRLRVLLLTSVVAVLSAGATAWLTVRHAASEVEESAVAQRSLTRTITTRLVDYAQLHGTWEGVGSTVTALKRQTGQHIRLLAEDGEVVVDSDNLDRRAARPVYPVSSAFVDAFPVMKAEGASDRVSVSNALADIDTYRSGARLAACLTRHGLEVARVGQSHGIPHLAASARARSTQPETVARCEQKARSAPDELTKDRLSLAAVVATCRTPSAAPATAAAPVSLSCASVALQQRALYLGPARLRLYLGPGDRPPQPVTLFPALLAAALVALAAVAGTLLVHRRLLRPVNALMTAARSLSAGDLSNRVPVTGRDEIAELATAFNHMADSLQQAEDQRRQMVADTAHELRNPLANIRGYLEGLSDGVLAPHQGLFASLHEEALLLTRVTDDLHLLALADAGNLRYRKAQLDLGELLEACRIAHQAAAKSARVELTVAAVTELTIDADSDRLRQAIGNLISNAVRATPAGGGITLQARADGEFALVEVADTGYGIAPEDQARIFDRFWRADPARSRTTGGSGLGLAITREIVIAHGGTISVVSTLDQGTTFTLRLPR